MILLAWRPFLDPIDAHGWWYLLLVPLALGISVVYKAVRVSTLDGYWKQVIVLTAQIVIGIVALGAASYALTQHVIPIIAPPTGG